MPVFTFDLSSLSSIWVQLLGFFMALVISCGLTPLVRQRAIEAGHYDVPGGRKIHKFPTPRLGGIAIWTAFTVTLVLFYMFFSHEFAQSSFVGLLIGGAIMFFVGVLDDIYDVSPYLKLFGQILAAITAFALHVQIVALDLPFSKILILHALSSPVTLVWIVLLSNAMNFIDGVDGLAGGVALISSITLAVVAFFMQEPTAAFFAIVLTGAVLGFLVLNFYPALIFMGDSGSLFCGFILAGIAVTGVLKTLTMTMLVPVVILTVPIVDITYSTLRRLWRSQSPFVADKEHLHHKLLHAGFSQVWTVGALYTVCILGGVAASSYIGRLSEYLIALGVLLVVSVGLFLSPGATFAMTTHVLT